MKIFDFILPEEPSESVALGYAHDDFFNGMEYLEMNKPLHSRYIDTVRGVEVYYDFGADYWFFAEA